LSPGDIERARDLIVHDAAVESVEAGQMGGEYGPRTWRDSRGRDAEHSPPHGPYDMPGEEEEEQQRKAMFAAREGRSTLGIPREVGEEFVGKAEDDDEWEGSNRPPSRRAPFPEPEDSEEDRKLKNILARFSRLDSGQIERAVELQRAGRLKQPRESSGSLDEPPDFPGKPRPGGSMVEMAGDAAITELQQLMAKMPPSTGASRWTRTFR
jgi:hypothetical protein